MAFASRLLRNCVEVIPGRLYWNSFQRPPLDTYGVHFFSTDKTLVYFPFHLDFGPPNLGCVYRFVNLLNHKLQNPSFCKTPIIYFSSNAYQHRANSVFLICAFCVLALRRSPEEAFRPFERARPPLSTFRDASDGPSLFGLTVPMCLAALRRAAALDFFDVQAFSLDEYDFYDRVENGDMNWVIPGRLLAFAGPVERPRPGDHPFPPRCFIPYFRKHNVRAVVRCSEPMYSPCLFEAEGIHHYDLPFADGAAPPAGVLAEFFQIMERREPLGAVAVHCREGLGRTGTLIACYLIRAFAFTAPEAIGYLRVVRPGSVVGTQQTFLCNIQSVLRSDVQLASRPTTPDRAAVSRGAAAEPLRDPRHSPTLQRPRMRAKASLRLPSISQPQLPAPVGPRSPFTPHGLGRATARRSLTPGFMMSSCGTRGGADMFRTSVEPRLVHSSCAPRHAGAAKVPTTLRPRDLSRNRSRTVRMEYRHIPDPTEEARKRLAPRSPRSPGGVSSTAVKRSRHRARRDEPEDLPPLRVHGNWVQ